MNIKWEQASTKRGAVWVVTFVIGLFMAWLGKDITQLLLLATGVAGGLGVMIDDNTGKI